LLPDSPSTNFLRVPRPSSPPPAHQPPDPLRYVESVPELRRLFTALKGESLLAVDTEAASFHRYHDRIYLIQLSSRTLTAVIDPLGVDDLRPIGRVLASKEVEIVFHDADYDLRLLDRDYAFRAKNVFDTRIAAQLLGEPGIGLAALLEKYQGVTLNKKYQRADWSARPLSAPMLEYAAMDTRHLLELRDTLRDQLEARGRLTWAEEEFKLLEAVRWTPKEDAGEEYLRLKGAKALKGRALARLRELYHWREDAARKADRAPFRILNNQPLLELAKAPPSDMEGLRTISGVGGETAKRYGRSILAAIERGERILEDALPTIKRHGRPKSDPEVERRLERLKAARNAIAKGLQLDPGVACPNGTLEAIARDVPESVEALNRLPAVRRWQAETFGAELLEAARNGGPAEPA